MKNWIECMKSMEIPERLKMLPKDHRGYVITYATLRDANGNPKFRWKNEKLRVKCFREKLCGVCGGPLDAVMVNIIDADFLKENDFNPSSTTPMVGSAL